MKSFRPEFKTLSYVISNSSKILLFAHSRPDGDTTGAVLALKEYFTAIGRHADIACFDPFPNYLENFTDNTFLFPDHIELSSYDCVIACDSVERGFDRIFPNISSSQVSVLIDHHPDISLSGDIDIIDPDYSSVCEIIYNYLKSIKFKLNKEIATFLMIGILGDTGNFQHANTTTRVMKIASELLKNGAPLTKIVNTLFTNKKLSTLKLWGRAFEKSKINPRNGMIFTVLTKNDIEKCQASTEDIAQVASILNTVPGSKFSLVLSEINSDKIKGSLRSEEYKGVDVSAIANALGGGGHRLASGFEVKGKIVETKEGWKII